MKAAPTPLNEEARLNSLQEYHLLDTVPEEVYDDITKIATELSGAPIASITLIDKDRQWFKSKQGFSLAETPREISFCAHAINKPSETMVVPDARYDDRFHDNPLTSGDPAIIFYAGVPIVTDDGHALGTICVMDSRPREMPEQKLEALKALGKLVKTQFELRKTRYQLQQYEQALEKARPIISQMVDMLQQNSSSIGTNNPYQAFSTQISELQSALKLTP